MIRIIVTDDHALIRSGFRRLAELEPDLRVVAEAADAAELRALLLPAAAPLATSNPAAASAAVGRTATQSPAVSNPPLPADVLILDLNLPDAGGLDLIADVRRLAPQLRIVVLSMHPEAHYGLRAIRAGAHAYLSKGCAPDDLFAAVRSAAAGRHYLTPGLADQLADELTPAIGRPAAVANEPPHSRLSNREYQLLVLLAEGKAVRSAAEQLNLSVNTVNSYRSRLLAKLGLQTNIELVHYAVQHGLIEP